VIVLDASIVVAYFNASERRHEAVATWLEAVDEDLVTTPLVLAEIDYVLGRRAGTDALDAFWADLDDGVYAVQWWPEALTQTIAAARDADIAVGLADARSCFSRLSSARIGSQPSTRGISRGCGLAAAKAPSSYSLQTRPEQPRNGFRTPR